MIRCHWPPQAQSSSKLQDFVCTLSPHQNADREVYSSSSKVPSLASRTWVWILALCHTNCVSWTCCSPSLSLSFLIYILKLIVSSSLWCCADNTKKDVGHNIAQRKSSTEWMNESKCHTGWYIVGTQEKLPPPFFPLSSSPPQPNKLLLMQTYVYYKKYCL